MRMLSSRYLMERFDIFMNPSIVQLPLTLKLRVCQIEAVLAARVAKK